MSHLLKYLSYFIRMEGKLFAEKYFKTPSKVDKHFRLFANEISTEIQ